MRRRTKVLTVLVPAIAAGLLALPTVAGASSGTAVPASFSFTGAGWGHGVGMSQYGALGQAKAGRNADQILKHYYTGATVGSYRDDVDVRVNLAYRSSKVRLRIEPLSTSVPQLRVTVGNAVVTAGPKDTLEFVTSGTGLAVKKNGTTAAKGTSLTARWSGTRSPGGAGSAPSVLNLVNGNSSFDTSGHRYRYGVVQARAAYDSSLKRTTLSVINAVRLHDEYVLGIAEMPSSWPAAALQAQAIAARGYAMVKYGQGIRSGCWCHVFKDTSDQVFAGYVKETSASGDRWRAAVKATNTSSTTSKFVLTSGKPAQTFYFSSSGGRTQNSEDVWGGKLSYLRSVADSWSLDAVNPRASWGPLTRSQAQVAQAVGLSNVARLDLSDRFASGAIRTAKAWDSKGASASVAGATLMSRLGLTSRWYKVSTPKVAPVIPSAYTVKSVAAATMPVTGGVVAGTVSPATLAEGKTVSVRRWDRPSGTWVYQGSARIGSDGRFAYRFTSTAPGTTSFRFFKGSDSCGSGCFIRHGATPGIPITFTDTPDVTASLSAPVIVQGTSSRLGGLAKPASATQGRTITLQRYTAGSWKTLARTTVRTDGSYGFWVEGRDLGRASYRALVESSGCSGSICLYRPGASAPRALTVAKPYTVKASFTRDGRGALSVKGTVSPAAVVQGKLVKVQHWTSVGWKDLGTARVSEGRFSASYTKLAAKNTSVRVVKTGDQCSGNLCIHPKGWTPTVTVRLG